MDFRFTDEQRMLADTASAFMQEVANSSATRQAMISDAGYCAESWQRLCEQMYWQGILVPEACGGLDLGFVEQIIVLEAMGERLHCSPLFSSVIATLALRSVPESAIAFSLLERICAGDIVSLAHTEARPDWGSEGVGVTASIGDSGWTLDGCARFIPFGHSANTFLIVARHAGGLGLFVADNNQPGVHCQRVQTMDQTRAMADLTLTNVSVAREYCLSTDFESTLDAVLDAARILLAADQVGGARKSLELSVDYVQERVQFGRSIASFQAIKHKAADMMVKAESARSLLYAAGCIADEWLSGYSDERALCEAAAMTSAAAGEAYFFTAGSGIQLHGGVGITEEYDIQLYFKRARSTEAYLGNPTAQREVVARLLLDGDS